MSDNVQNITMDILEGIQDSLTGLRTEMLRQFEAVDRRCERIESGRRPT